MLNMHVIFHKAITDIITGWFAANKKSWLTKSSSKQSMQLHEFTNSQLLKASFQFVYTMAGKYLPQNVKHYTAYAYTGNIDFKSKVHRILY